MKIKVLLTQSERYFSTYAEALNFCMSYVSWWRMYVIDEDGNEALFMESLKGNI